MAKKDGTKLCKHCKTEIPAGAKVCPNCRKKQGGILKWILIGIIVICVIGSIAGGGSDKSEQSSASNSKSSKTAEPKQEEKAIEYTAYSVNDMISDLNSNAMKASKKYKDQYIEITGKLSNIDSNGKYISLSSDDEFSLYNVQCYIMDDAQTEKVMEMEMDQQVTLKGKCTDVGEVLGYSLDIDEIE